MPITKVNSLGITNPVAFSAGTAALPSITTSGDTNTGVFFPAADTIGFTEGGTERMRIDSNGNLMVGVTTLNAVGGISIKPFETDGATQVLWNRTSTSNTSYPLDFKNGGVSSGYISYNNTSTTYSTSSDYRLKENVNYNFDATTRLKQLKPARFNFIADANRTVDGFLAHEVQDIIPEAITGTKDETKTKEKVVVNSDGGVIAENIEQADWEAGKIPNENGNTLYPIDSIWEATKEVPIYQGIDQSKLTPILTKALQEAIAKIESLEATSTSQQTKIESLEARLTALESK
jgi:hypothetical protein